MKRKITIHIGLVMAILLQIAACKKLDLVPTNRFTEENYWTSPEKANMVLNTAYSQMFKADYFFYNEALSDNAYSGRGDQQGVTSIASGVADASLPRFKEEWRYHYEGIKTCNIFLQYVDRVPGFDETLKNRMKAEIRFLRAFQYFQLYTWFGDVPLFDRDLSVTEAKSVSRAPRAQVMQFVLDELDAIAGSLPLNTDYPAADRGRITRGAVLGLKARVLLFDNRWDDVVTVTEQLINSNTNGTYGLFPSYEGLFLPQNEYNQEVILDLQYEPQFRSYEHFFDLAPISVGARTNAMAPTQELVDDYIMLNGKSILESGSGYDEENPYINRDPRLTATIVYHGYQWKKPDGSTQTIYIKPGTDPDQGNKPDEFAPGAVSSPTGYYIRKYYDPSSGVRFRSGLNLILIRYADILLMYAEAKNELDQMSQDVWNKTIRAIRSRAGFTQSSALDYNASATQEQMRQLIRRERRTELALEGLRIFDIRRWKIAEQVLNGWAHGARFGDPTIDNGYIRANQRSFDKLKHYLWAIPRDERNLNNNLSQNDSW